jgi:hypothetical protein
MAHLIVGHDVPGCLAPAWHHVPYRTTSASVGCSVVLERIIDGCGHAGIIPQPWVLGASLAQLAYRAFTPITYKLGILLVLFCFSHDNLPPFPMEGV